MESPHGNGPVRWVSCEWLEANLRATEMSILDVQPSVHDYIYEHIPGAVYLGQGVLRGWLRAMPVRYLPPEAVEQVFRGVGLRGEVPVVVYTGTGAITSRGDGLEQTMMAYALARFGHDAVYVLDGGVDKWKQEERPLTKTFPAVEPSNWTAQVRRKYYLEYEEFKALKDQEGVVVIDSRPPALYEGQGHWTKPGHIPGAINLPWPVLLDESNRCLLKPRDQMLEILQKRGVTSASTVICSCGTGRKATLQFLTLKCHLGYPSVRLYEGSFTEWSAYPENPTVMGKHPR